MTNATRQKWINVLDQTKPITKSQWQEFLRECCPSRPEYTVHLVYDEYEKNWFAHDMRYHSDESYGDCGMYRAGIQAQLTDPKATIVLDC